MTAVLLVGGTLFDHRRRVGRTPTLGALDPCRAVVLAGFFQAVMPRTAGFNSVDTGRDEPTAASLACSAPACQ